MTFRLFAALVLTMIGTMEAQVTTKTKPIKLEDPGIPGLRLIHSSDPEFAKLPEAKAHTHGELGNTYAIRNDTKKRITGFSVVLIDDERQSGEAMVLNPLQAGMKGVAPGESAVVWPLGMWTPGDGALYGSNAAPKNKAEFFISYVAFEDGTFYGYEEEFDYVAAGLEWLTGFGKAALAAPDLVAFMKQQETQMWGREMTLKSSAAAHGVSDTYQLVGGLFALDHDTYVKDPAKGRALIEKHLAITHRHAPGFKRMKSAYYEIRPGALEPENAMDGWRFEGFFSQCWNQGGLFPSGPSIGGMDAPTCTFPANAAAATVTDPNYLANYGIGVNYYDPPLAWAFSASCIQSPPNTYAGPNDNIPRRYLAGGENYHIPSTAAQNLEPTNRLFYQVTTNGPAMVGWGDSVYANRVLGILQPYNPQIDVIEPGSSTICQERYLDPDVFLELQAKGIPVDAMPAVKVDYLTHDNTSGSDYGYVVINTRTTYRCGGTTIGRKKTLVFAVNSYFANGRPSVKYGYASDGRTWINYTHCDHFPATTAGGGGDGGGGQTCSLGNDCCCCQNAFPYGAQCLGVCGNAFNDVLECVLPIGLTLNPTSAPTTVTTSVNPSAGDAQAGLPPILNPWTDKIGFYRPSLGVWWEDAFGSHITNNTAAQVHFTPPGGVQSGDVPVSGDWAGIGISTPGFFRPSTGEWWLDASGDNAWGSGDYHYQFGQAGDVPVVGDWRGGGQTCVGVFRYGSLWILDADCNGYWTGNDLGQDSIFSFGGIPGDIPVVGRWGNIAQSQVGVVRCYVAPGASSCTSPNFLWVMDWGAGNVTDQGSHGTGQGANCGINAQYRQYYQQCNTPEPFAFGGIAGDQFIAGDWWGLNHSNVAVYRPGNGLWILDNGTDPINHSATTVYAFGGLPGDIAVKGKW